MSENKLYFYESSSAVAEKFSSANARSEPATCTEAEPFALRVLDDSMQPEFRKGCIIVIDPTGRATHGSYVLSCDSADNYLFRQLSFNIGSYCLSALNEDYPQLSTAQDLSEIVGVIVQRAGVRRSYHKHYS